MRAKPGLDLEKAIGELGVGEALVSLLDAKGIPGITERAWVLAPGSRIGPITDDERKQLLASSLVAGTYEHTIDRESAYEKLKGRAAAPASSPTAAGSGAPAPVPTAGQPEPAHGGGWLDQAGEILGGLTKGTGKTGRGDSILESMAKSAARTVGSQVGRELIRGVLGSLLGSGKKK